MSADKKGPGGEIHGASTETMNTAKMELDGPALSTRSGEPGGLHFAEILRLPVFDSILRERKEFTDDN